MATDVRNEPIDTARALSSLAVLLLFLWSQPARAEGSDVYRLAVGDVVAFDFLDDALASEQLTIASDGRVSLPLIGSFPVAGMTVEEASEAIRLGLVERKLLVEPQVSFSIAQFRPIYVLGDVKAPGSYPFQPMMNVEQAVALAGGQSTGGASAEDRVVTQARLRGDLDEASVEIAREAIAAARVQSQLGGRERIEESDLPAQARDYIDAALMSALMPNEQRILEVERRGYDVRHAQLTAAVGEVNGALQNLNLLAENQKAAIVSARENLERNRGLYERGIKTLTDMAANEREVAAQESHLLEIYNQMSTTRRELGELQRQLSDAADTWTRGALVDLQGHFAEIERLLASRRATEEQIMLLSSLTAEEMRADSTVVFAYEVRNRRDGRTETRLAELLDEIGPGDTVLVSIDTDMAKRSAALSGPTIEAVP